MGMALIGALAGTPEFARSGIWEAIVHSALSVGSTASTLGSATERAVDFDDLWWLGATEHC